VSDLAAGTRIERAVRSRLARAFAVDEARLAPETSLRDDLGADSIALVEALAALEEELDVELPETEAFLAGLQTVRDVVAAFEREAAP
jgi:acyl carrier protein